MAGATRLMVDITGGYVADLPSDKDFLNPEVGPLLKKYLMGATGIPLENRIKMFRLVEKMAMESADKRLRYPWRRISGRPPDYHIQGVQPQGQKTGRDRRLIRSCL